MPNLTTEGRLAIIDDVQRDFLFEVHVPDISDMTGKVITQEGLIIRTKTAAIPSRGNSTIESFFAGTKQIFPGRPTFSNLLAIGADETEDQLIMKAMYEWRQRIFDTDPNSLTAGYSKSTNKRALSTSIILRQYKYNGDPLDNDIVFYNAWPSEMGEVALNMEGNGKVQYPITFSYDYWLLEPSEG